MKSQQNLRSFNLCFFSEFYYHLENFLKTFSWNFFLLLSFIRLKDIRQKRAKILAIFRPKNAQKKRQQPQKRQEGAEERQASAINYALFSVIKSILKI